ncbi:MAG: sulfurtransferase TusA family protein [Candidatus Omnitrophica bacterium]|nr:sulfurtransferase TusA family protein [Candidatus Omnitrophota bacterium]MCA9416968.1 sulfurtransferase TusA family protein [Candidatus Omnitrophota bacterium]MCA9435263.1 sulfurtransferase TusA family protein [Candidatus Omnitrophota bacterium]MCA9444149.1 sulfurtransferase TusA family protein [Candidatus Omnitrophota bacterium]MCA9450587.1 sulfurtransferase TusA family protein [Candidatus Omnitrophota bacterium]
MSQEVSSIPAIDSTLDLSGVVCPMNFVKTKLQLELMQSGQVLEVIIDRGEPVRNVPQSVKNEGHKILHAEEREGQVALWIQKA